MFESIFAFHAKEDPSFILGKDPKPMPPPFRLTKEMVEAMGGPESEQFRRFKKYCCQV